MQVRAVRMLGREDGYQGMHMSSSWEFLWGFEDVEGQAFS